MSRISENTKITLTIGQLRKLVKESTSQCLTENEDENRFRDFYEVKSDRIQPIGEESFGGTEGRPATYQSITIDGVEAGYIKRRECSIGGVFAHALQPDKYKDHDNFFILVVNPLDKDGNEINFLKEVGEPKDLSFPNEEWWEVVFKTEEEVLAAFDKLQRKFDGAVFDFSDEAVNKIIDWQKRTRCTPID